MRNLINLIEGVNPRLKNDILVFTSKLAGEPLYIKWDRPLAATILKSIKKAKDSSDDPTAYDVEEYVRELAERWYRRNSPFFRVKKEVNEAVAEYQNRMSQKMADDSGDREPQPHQFVESSHYLTAMEAQKHLGTVLDLMTFTDASMSEAVQATMDFLTTWSENSIAPRYSEETPYEAQLTVSMREGLSQLITLMMLVATVKN